MQVRLTRNFRSKIHKALHSEGKWSCHHQKLHGWVVWLQGRVQQEALPQWYRGQNSGVGNWWAMIFLSYRNNGIFSQSHISCIVKLSTTIFFRLVPVMWISSHDICKILFVIKQCTSIQLNICSLLPWNIAPQGHHSIMTGSGNNAG